MDIHAERMNNWRLFDFCNGGAVLVISYFIDMCILHKYMINDFEEFLNKFKHELYHKWQPEIPCCECFRSVSLASKNKRKKLKDEQMRTIYDVDRRMDRHVKKQNGLIKQECLCKWFTKPGIKTSELDIQLVHFILKICAPTEFMLIKPQIKTILDMQNELAHKGCQAGLSEADFNSKWTTLENAVLTIAKHVNYRYADHAQQMINDYKKKDITLSLRRIYKELIFVQERIQDWSIVFEGYRTNTSKLENIETKLESLGQIGEDTQKNVGALITDVRQLRTYISEDRADDFHRQMSSEAEYSPNNATQGFEETQMKYYEWLHKHSKDLELDKEKTLKQLEKYKKEHKECLQKSVLLHLEREVNLKMLHLQFHKDFVNNNEN